MDITLTLLILNAAGENIGVVMGRAARGDATSRVTNTEIEPEENVRVHTRPNHIKAARIVLRPPKAKSGGSISRSRV